MRIPCEHTNLGTEKWISGWIVGFVFNNDHECAYAIVETPKGELLEKLLCEVLVKRESEES